jgi:hypothetical protein
MPNNFIEYMLGAIIGLVTWIFRTVTSRQDAEIKALREEQKERWEEHKRESQRRDELEDRRRAELQTFFSGLLAKHSEEMKNLVTEVWTEVREFKLDRRRYDEEVWRQINALKERQAAAELQQAKSYHTKTEFDALLAEKLSPIKQALNDISRQIGNKRNSNNDN